MLRFKIVVAMSLLGGIGGGTDSSKEIHTITTKELRVTNIQLLDVRAPGEFKNGHIPGAQNADIKHIGFLFGKRIFWTRKDLFISIARPG